MARVYKIATAAQWRAAEAAGVFAGSPVDRADGFIHLSTATQVPGTLARHFDALPDLLLITVDTTTLDTALRWEPSRDGQPFPHLYAPLPLSSVLAVLPIPLDPAGRHLLPPLERDDGST